VPASLCRPCPSLLSLPPAPAQGGPRQGFQPGLQVNQVLVAPRKIPWKHSGPRAPGQQDSPLLRAVGVCWTREETCSELFVPRNPGSRAKYLESSQASTCLSGMRVLTPQDCSPVLSSGGCCSLQSVLVAGPLPSPFQGRTRLGGLTCPPLGGWGEVFSP